MKRNGFAQIPVMIGLLIMAVAVPVATKLVQQSQDTRNKATTNSTCGGENQMCCSSGTRCTAAGTTCKNLPGGSFCIKTSGPTSTPIPTRGPTAVPRQCTEKDENMGCNYIGNGINCAGKMGIKHTSTNCSVSFKCVASGSCAPTSTPTRAPTPTIDSCSAVSGRPDGCRCSNKSQCLPYHYCLEGSYGSSCSSVAPTPALVVGALCTNYGGGYKCLDNGTKSGLCSFESSGFYWVDIVHCDYGCNTGNGMCKAAPTATPVPLKNNCNSGDSCVSGMAGSCSGGTTYGFSGVCQYNVLGRGQDGICCTKTAPTPAYGDTCEGTKGGTCWDLDARKMGECTQWVPGNYVDCFASGGGYYGCCKKVGTNPAPTETASQCSPLTDSVTCANTPGCYWHSDTKKCSNVKPTIPTATPTPNTRPPITATPTATGPLKCYCEGNCADKICNWQSAPGNGYTGYCSNTSCQNIPTPRLPSPTSAVGGSSCYCINACYTGATCAYTGYMPAPYVKCPTNSFCNSTNPTATPTTGGGGGTNPSPTGSGAGSGCDGAIPRDICDTNRLSINAQCVNNGWDYDVQLCDQAGRKETCGGRPYCCPSAGGQWTTDMTACGGSGGACTQCAGHPDWKVKGDADCSGTTTINDFSVWKSEYISGNFGTDTKNSWNADFNCDGKVTLNDGSIWTANFIKGLTN